MLSLHDVLIGKLPVRTHAAVVSLADIRRRNLRLRNDLLADPTSVVAMEASVEVCCLLGSYGESEGSEECML